VSFPVILSQLLLHCQLQDFRSCLNEKKFQEVLEAVSYQRLVYREQREAALAKEKARQLLRR
jgi:hypothetical protein